jgi:chromatin segregation and condensation protein Rec8/ScpA/Scc1 (kleisin family)
MNRRQHSNNTLPEAQAALTPEEQLESILYQFIALYERWSEDRQVASKQGAEVAQLVKAFSAEVVRFSGMEKEVVVALRQALSKTVAAMGETFQGVVSQAVDQALDHSASKLRESVSHAERLLARYQAVVSWGRWKFMALMVATSVLTSVVVVELLMPRPVAILDEHGLATYELGKSFGALWPMLSKEKQAWFMEKTQPH